MSRVETTEAHLKRFERRLWHFGSSSLVALCMLSLVADHVGIRAYVRARYPWLIHALAALFLALGIVVMLVGPRSLLDSRPTPVLAEKGIRMLSTKSPLAPQGEFVRWAGMLGFAFDKEPARRHVIIKVSVPARYEQTGRFILGQIKRMSRSEFGSPIVVPTRGLEIGAERFIALCMRNLARYRLRN